MKCVHIGKLNIGRRISLQIRRLRIEVVLRFITVTVLSILQLNSPICYQYTILITNTADS